jgi:DNA-binding response OmpR family regulator
MTHILLVEDELALASVIQAELTTADYTVRLAHNGLDALALFNAQTFDLVILDWMMPGLDGLETLRRLRTTSAVPVLMLTARSEEIDRVIGLELGADDYLTKPFGMRELMARVRALLRRSEQLRHMLQADSAPAAAEVRSGPLVLLPESFAVTINDQPVDLTRTEFELLHLLVRNPGRVFNRSYLLDTLWNAAYVDGDRAVDNAVLRLRKKLGPLADHIETVWGVGYRWKRDA